MPEPSPGTGIASSDAKGPFRQDASKRSSSATDVAASI